MYQFLIPNVDLHGVYCYLMLSPQIRLLLSTRLASQMFSSHIKSTVQTNA